MLSGIMHAVYRSCCEVPCWEGHSVRVMLLTAMLFRRHAVKHHAVRGHIVGGLAARDHAVRRLAINVLQTTCPHGF